VVMFALFEIIPPLIKHGFSGQLRSFQQ
jgi:hypothetical protein